MASSASIFLKQRMEPLMNKYGTIGQQHWAKYAPARYAVLEDPERFFTELGEQVAAEVAASLSALEQTIPADTPYLEKVGTLNAMRSQAEEAALTELVFSVEAEWRNPLEELEGMLADLPSAEMVQASLGRLAEQAEADGGWTAEADQERQQLVDLLPLVSTRTPLEQLSEPELTDWILKLRPFWDPETRALVRLP